MEIEVDSQRVTTFCFAASSSRKQSAMLWSGVASHVSALADMALHIALTLSSGIRPNAGGMDRGSKTPKNKNAGFIRSPI
jgi:hypothetical protein